MVKIERITLGKETFPMGYKVVTQDLESLGLRNNPHIIRYPINQWYALPLDQVVRGSGDFGGM